jgi:hypothetical protein
LKELLGRVAESVRLILWLDDVQWADEDGNQLLHELLAPPDPPPCLLILSYREAPNTSEGKLLDSLAVGSNVQKIHVPLEPLTGSESLALLKQLLRTSSSAAGDVERLANESEGSPFLTHQLARYLNDVPGPLADDLHLGDLLARRIGQLTVEARRLLEVIAVAGGPLEHTLALHAAGFDESSRQVLQVLERGFFVHASPQHMERRTEIYHHRIRDTVLGLIAEGDLHRHHRTIADAMLTAPSPNLITVLEHYEAAHDLDAVRRYIVAGARQACSVLAFDLASRLYRRAIELGGTELTPWELRARLGDVLANVARNGEAGRCFAIAAELAAPHASNEQVSFLRWKTAEEFLKSGQHDEATRALETVTAPLGVHFPKNFFGATARTLANRAKLLVRGLTPHVRAQPGSSEAGVDRLHVLWVLMMTFGHADPHLGGYFGSRLLLDALDSGDEEAIIHGLAAETVNWSVMSGALVVRQVDRMFTLFDELSRTSPDRRNRAGYHQCRGMAYWLQGRLLDAERELEEAIRLFRAERDDVRFHIGQCQPFRLATMAQLGRLKTLRQELSSILLDAEDRGDDLLLYNCAAGVPSIAYLTADEPDVARKWANRVLSWAGGNHSSHAYNHFVTVVQADLYEGDAASAWERTQRTFPLMRRAHMLELSHVRDELLHLRARAAVALAEQVRDGRERAPGRWTFERLVESAAKDAAAIAKHGLPFSDGLVALTRAGIASLRREPLRVAHLLSTAIDAFGDSGMALHQNIATLVRSALDPRSHVVARNNAAEWIREEEVADVGAMTRLIAPGCSAGG